MIARVNRGGGLSAAWVGGSVLVILLATLPPQPDWSGAGPQPLRTLLPLSRGAWLDIVQNVALYLPFGLFLAARGRTAVFATVVAAALSIGTELLQVVIPGRSPTVRDVLVNVVGAFLGHALHTSAIAASTLGLAAACEGYIRRSAMDRRAASILSASWAAVVSAIVLSTAALLVPALPDSILSVSSPFLDRTNTPLRIGGSGDSASAFAGVIDEVRVFNRARTAAEIASDVHRPVRSDPHDDSLVVAHSFEIVEDNAIGATWTADGRFGGALEFDGVSDRLVRPFSPALAFRDEMTLEAWVRPAQQHSSEPTLVSRVDGTYFLDYSSSAGAGYVAGGGHFGGVSRYAQLPYAVRSGRWTHLAVTYDGRVIRLYVDGKLEASRVHWSAHRPVRVSLDGKELLAGDLPDPEAIRRALHAEPTLDLLIACGADPTPAAAPLFLLAALQNRDALSIDASGTDLLIHPWTRARGLNLASPPTRVSGALSRCSPGQVVHITVEGPLQNPAVKRDNVTLAPRAPGVGSGWAFLVHGDLLTRRAEMAVAFTWMALLIAPLVVWTRRTALSLSSLGAAALAFACAPYLFSVAPLRPIDVSGILGGIVLGTLLRMRARRDPSRPGARTTPDRE